MRDYTFLVASILFVFALYLTWEALRAKKDRAALKHVIYVNGTRGKSTVTRMIDAGLRSAGFKVLCKTTGTLPLCIHVDGREEEICRSAPANIREQLRYLHKAAEEGADILVIECMALDPKLQRVSSRQMLRADIGVLTNARLDHTDVMGDTREDVLDAMMNMLPVKGRIFTAERDLFPQLREEAKRLKSSVELALAEEVTAWPAIDFPDNTALALKVCRALSDVPAQTLMDGIAAFRRDPFALKLYRKGKLRLVNAFSANDLDSTHIILEQSRGAEDERLAVLINNRADRPVRTKEMLRFCALVQPHEIWLLGQQQDALVRACRRKVPQAELRCFASAEEIPLTAPDAVPLLIMAVGNIRDEGIRLSERAAREMTAIEAAWQ